jgi:two-component system osmolarity sensor histidine kinase EnvZ
VAAGFPIKSLHAGLRRLWPRLLKKWLPRSLFGRSLLIIVLPIALMQGAVVWGFYEAHLRVVTAQLSDGLAGDVALDVQELNADPSSANLNRVVQRAERLQSLSLALHPGDRLPTGYRRPLFSDNGDALRQALDDLLPEPIWVDTNRYPAYLDIRVQLAGGVLRIIAPRDRAFAAQGHLFVGLLAGATLLLTSVAIIFIRNQVRSIERLAEAAEAFGKGVEAPRFKPHGAAEVRQAAHAFLDMKERIQRHIDQRTALLASVSHDLRTPLTRLRLEAALAPPGPHIEAVKRDLLEMEHMIDEYLAFARGEGGESVEQVGVRRLIDEVSEGALRAGAQVAVAADPALAAAVRPNALKRALSNLVMNAAAHGEHVEVAAHTDRQGGLEIWIDDDGPGIPPDRYEEAFRPFARLDEARNQNVKGVGLGLAIARDVARGHGGDVTLAKSPLGGLRAVMRLPG